MSNISKGAMQKVENMIRIRIIPRWVESFLQKKFFERCSEHEFQRNELNRYCIACDASLCKYCIAHGCHTGHNILTVNRYTYQSVVPLSEMEVYFDCEKIQPYKCNRKAVVSLNPLAHNGSDVPVKGQGNCYVCKRKLTDGGRFMFCSIACKVQAVLEAVQLPVPDVATSTEVRASPDIVTAPEAGTSQQIDEAKQPVIASKRKRSRKGVPRRAPLF